METHSLAKWIIFLGIGIVLFGLLILIGAKLGIPFGKLPGDIQIQKEKYAIYFPIITSIVVSIILTIIINVIIWLSRK